MNKNVETIFKNKELINGISMEDIHTVILTYFPELKKEIHQITPDNISTIHSEIVFFFHWMKYSCPIIPWNELEKLASLSQEEVKNILSSIKIEA